MKSEKDIRQALSDLRACESSLTDSATLRLNRYMQDALQWVLEEPSIMGANLPELRKIIERRDACVS